ncbi:MAG TPA: pyridoxamine 5'-phosphate oxidase family protein [Flavisolibacter sp.]|nr:pyridoxamine 5'-phosphate oxidase family protein [Flavisolibacter sp.]
MDKRISRFIKGQKVATICCVEGDNKPYCFSCFYAFDEAKMQLYFKSAANTHHMQLLKDRPFLSGSILPDKLNPLALQGIQFSGLLIDKIECAAAKSVYHNRYPFALAMSGTVYTIELQWIKMTDNTLNFGTKLIWEKPLVVVC